MISVKILILALLKAHHLQFSTSFFPVAKHFPLLLFYLFMLPDIGFPSSSGSLSDVSDKLKNNSQCDSSLLHFLKMIFIGSFSWNWLFFSWILEFSPLCLFFYADYFLNSFLVLLLYSMLHFAFGKDFFFLVWQLSGWVNCHSTCSRSRLSTNILLNYGSLGPVDLYYSSFKILSFSIILLFFPSKPFLSFLLPSASSYWVMIF